MTGLDLPAIVARKKLVEGAAKAFARRSGRAMDYFAAVQDSAKDVPALLAEVERLTAELAAMTELHDQKHRDWQAADNARQGLLVDRGNLRADLQLYEPAHYGAASFWVHACGWVEVWTGDGAPTGGGHACESGSDIPADWQPLYIRRGGEPS
jgi:hypothetical protein